MSSSNTNIKSIKHKKVFSQSWKLLFIFILSFIFYGNSLKNEYNIDDEFVTNNNPLIKKGLAGIPEIFTSYYSQREGLSYGYRPLVKVSYALEYQFFGFNPGISHFINILIYCMGCLLLFLVLKKIFHAYHSLIPLFACLLFLMHPIHTEAVNSLKNRDELLSLMFGMMAWLMSLKFYESKKPIWLIAALLAYAAALLSKISVLPYLIIIPLSIHFFYSKPATEKKNNYFTNIFKEFHFKLALSIFFFSVFFHFLILILLRQGGAVFFASILPAYLFSYNYFLIKQSPYFLNQKIKPRLFLIITNLFIITAFAIFFKNSFFWWIPAFLLSVFSLVVIITKPVELFSKFLKHLDRFIRKHFFTLIISLIFIILFAILYFNIKTTLLEDQQTIISYWQNPIYFNDSVATKLSVTILSITYYIRLLIVPFPLLFYYGYNMLPSTASNLIIAIVTCIILGIVLFLSIKKYNRRSLYAFALMYFLLSLSMYTNFFVTVAGIIAERLVLYASLGFSIASALIILRISGIRQNDRSTKRKQAIVAWILLATTGIVYFVLTFNRNEQWQSRETLFLHDIRYLKNSVKANDLTAAMLYQQAMKSSNAKDALKKLEQSAAYYKQAVNVMPDHFSAYKNIGLIYLNYLNRPAEAVHYFKQYLVTGSNDQESLLHLAYAYDRTERKDSAIITLKKLMAQGKTDPALRSYLSNLYYYSDNKTMALAINDSLKSEYPSSEIPFINMGNYAIFDKDTIAAIDYWEKAFAINPGNLNVCNTLYSYFLNVNDSSKANYYQEKINKLKSDNK